jgi:hypothetical protein
MRRAAKVDTGHTQISDGIKRAGYQVFDVHAMPGRLDLDVLTRRGLILVLEIKNNSKVTEAEKKYIDAGWPCVIVHTLAEALLELQKADAYVVTRPDFKLCAQGMEYFYQWVLCLEAKDNHADTLRDLYRAHRESCLSCNG